MDKIRIGIDVGGTFTHAAALSGAGVNLIGQAKVPTTHTAPEGVSAGIAAALRLVLGETHAKATDVARVAYSTTQATNALLEGDVSPVGILAAGQGWEGRRAASETEPGDIELAPGLHLSWHHAYLDAGQVLSEQAIKEKLLELKAKGAGAIVAASAFSVDNPELELKIVAVAQALGLPATATHEMSKLYGLKARTRTAAVNAAILPKMLETALKTEEAVRSLGITAPLVVMRSDGGAMDISEMKRRPILTILSGPAAGVAAALMAARVSDGIFLEVGGTSTDISCIQNGHPSSRMARIGRHALYLNTLDVRTVGVAGGSMVRTGGKRVRAVGPRSAHIAGLPYSTFSKSSTMELSAAAIAPKPSDPSDYLILNSSSGHAAMTVTPTCAANALKRLPAGDYSTGDVQAAGSALESVGRFLGCSKEEAAEQILEEGAKPICKVVEELIKENRLDRSRIRLVGGGGGAGVWTPEVGRRMNLPFSVAEHAPIISAIGAALSLLQETVERTMVNPGPADIAKIRQDAEQTLVRSGAAPESIEIRVEVDSSRGILRATAVGAQEMSAPQRPLSDEEVDLKARELLQGLEAHLAAQTEKFRIYQAQAVEKKLFGLLHRGVSPWRVLDRRGFARLGSSHGEIIMSSGKSLLEDLGKAMNRHARFGDAGKMLPPAFLVTDDRAVDLSGLGSEEQMYALCREELARLSADAPVVVALNLESL